MTKTSTCKGLEVFDFKEDDEVPESSSMKYMEKFTNRTEDQAMLKYNFLRFVAVETIEEIKKVKILPDVVAIDSDHSCDNGISCTPPGKVGDDYASTEVKSGLHEFPQSETTSNGNFHNAVLDHGSIVRELEMKTCSPRESSPDNNAYNCVVAPESPSNDEPVGMVADDDESLNECSPSTSSSNLLESNNRCSPAHGFGCWQTGDKKSTVSLCPDFLVCQDTFCTDVLMCFTSSYIQISGSLQNGNLETNRYQWGVDDIVDVECRWYSKVETAMVKLHVISHDTVGSSDALDPSGQSGQSVSHYSGIQELTFAVMDSNWPQEQENIISLNARYKDMWNVVIDNDMEMDEDVMLEKIIKFSSKQFFPIFDQPFEEVIYPKGDSDPVSISKRDVELLRPESFINDTIIDFYIKYLKNKIQPEENHRFHFFNSFFFRKLADLEKDPFIDSEGRAAFLRVRKWTRKVNLFVKDYIFIPVNFNYHWSLIVICHPGEVATFKDEDAEKALKVPCILHMDSIKGTHSGLKNHIQSYLWEEWKEKQNEVSVDISSKFHNMRFIPLELPQQENLFDCGLFLLHYVELFLEEAPDNFSPFKISKFSSFLNVDWFPPTEASLKRVLILRLIHEVLENHSPETSPEDNCDEEHNNKNRTGVEFLSMNFNNSSKTCPDDLSGCQTSQGIESSSIQSSHYRNDLGSSVKENNDTGTSNTVFEDQIQAFDQTTSFYRYKGPMEPIEEEDTETGEHFESNVLSSTYGSEDLIPQRCCLEEGGFSIKPKQVHDNSSIDSSSLSNNSDEDDDSSDIGIVLETSSFEKCEQLIQTNDMENFGKLHEFSSCRENSIPDDDPEEMQSDEDDDDTGKIQRQDDRALESYEQKAAKRMRFSPPFEQNLH